MLQSFFAQKDSFAENNKAMSYQKQAFTFLLILSVFITNTRLMAQDSSRTLSLKELLEQATVNNNNVQLAKMDESIATAKYKESQSYVLPQANLSYAAFTSNNPLNAFGFKLQQKAVTAADFNPALLNDPAGIPNFMTQLQVQVPLLNLDMQYMRKSAYMQTAIYQFKTQRTLEQIVFQATQAFLQLKMTYDAQKVLVEGLQTMQSLYKFTNDRFQQGLLQKSDLLNIEVQIKSFETNIAENKSAIANISDLLAVFMNKPTGVIYTITETNTSGSFAELTDSLPEQRSDFKAMETAIASYDMLLKSSRKSFLPRLNAFANYQLHDKSMLGFGAGAYMAGIQLSWDIFKGYATKNKIATQQLEKNKIAASLQNQKQESKIALLKTNRQYKDASFKMEQQKAAILQSKEAVRILQNRYQQGLVNTIDVLIAQTQLSQQQLGYAEAAFSKQLALAYQQFLTATTK